MNPSAHVFRYSRSYWQRRMRLAQNPSTIEAREGVTAITFSDQSRSASAFADICNLLIFVLYDERRESARLQSHALRFSAYRVSQVPHGVQWGGANNCHLFKDLCLTPRAHARGPRLDRCRSTLLSTALKLESRLSRLARYPAAPRKRFTLPRVWAGFRRSDTSSLRGDGPEFQQACKGNSLEPSELFRAASRAHFGLVLFPLEWVAGQLDRSVAVFAELTPSVRHQTFRCDAMPDGLVGFQGANAFDFYGSRYRAVVAS